MTSGGSAAAVVVAGAESAPQPACRRERALQTPHSKERRRQRWASPPYPSSCLWMSLSSGLCCPDWPRPVCDAHLWLGECLSGTAARGSGVCLESSVFSRAAAVRLRRASESEARLTAAQQAPGFKPLTCLPAADHRRGLAVLRVALPLLLQQLPHVRHLRGRRGFGPAL